MKNYKYFKTYYYILKLFNNKANDANLNVKSSKGNILYCT